MPRIFVEDYSFQLCKYEQRYCGDVWKVQRTTEATVAMLADGIGSGIPANVSATLTVEYFFRLISGGFTLAEAVKNSLKILRTAKLNNGPWAAFNIVSISPDGELFIYSYESPQPVLMTIDGLEQLTFNPQYYEGEIIHETSTHIKPTETMLLFTDGVTQAGLGRGLQNGWSESGVRKYLTENELIRTNRVAVIPRTVVYKASSISQNRPADDITAAVLYFRRPKVLQILTGPPLKRELDSKIMGKFLAAEGIKAVCGGTTTSLLAKHMGIVPQVHPGKYGAPAHSELKGIALACEGAITLNRANNIFDEPDLSAEAGFGATRLIELFADADEIYFWVGQSKNIANINSLKPVGMLSRNDVIDSLAKKLRLAGKLVNIMKI